MTIPIEQRFLIETLEHAARNMESETDDERYYSEMEKYFAAMTALNYSPREQHSREVLARMIRCIIDGNDLNPMFATCCGICTSYALSLSESETEGYSIAMQEAIKAAPERLPASPTYFGREFFQGYINMLYDDNDSEIYLEPALSAFKELLPDQRNDLLSYIWSLAGENAGRYGSDPKETQYGVIFNRIKQGLTFGP